LLCISTGVLSAGTLHIRKLIMASPIRRVQIKKACEVGQVFYGTKLNARELKLWFSGL
jgi:hypothetical protein